MHRGNVIYKNNLILQISLISHISEWWEIPFCLIAISIADFSLKTKNYKLKTRTTEAWERSRMELESAIEILNSFSIWCATFSSLMENLSHIVIYESAGPLLKKTYHFVMAVGPSYVNRTVKQNKLKKKLKISQKEPGLLKWLTEVL